MKPQGMKGDDQPSEGRVVWEEQSGCESSFGTHGLMGCECWMCVVRVASETRLWSQLLNATR